MNTAIVTTKGQVVIPAKLRRKLGIKQGTRVVFDEKNSTIVIRPITEAYVGSLQGMLAGDDAENWAEEIVQEHAEEVAKEG